MSKIFDGFTKKKNFLVCIDSDGCAMDTMNSKHFYCFGPCMIEEWELTPWKDEVQRRWNEVNLYTMTRGINRFKGLAMLLNEVDRTYKSIEGIEEFSAWADKARELSNASLSKMMEKSSNTIFKKALAWSVKVNQMVEKLPECEKKPFGGVAEGLWAIHQKADVAIVSSANQDAIEKEWKAHNLLQHTDILLSQDCGSKAYCIGRLLEKGYLKKQVLMVGDAPGDWDAASANGVLYFPILVKKESSSWNRLLTEGLEKFIDGTYQGAYQQEQIEEFERNLQ